MWGVGMFDSASQLLQSPRVEHLQPETSRPRTPKADSSDRMESTLARRATLCFFPLRRRYSRAGSAGACFACEAAMTLSAGVKNTIPPSHALHVENKKRVLGLGTVKNPQPPLRREGGAKFEREGKPNHPQLLADQRGSSRVNT